MIIALTSDTCRNVKAAKEVGFWYALNSNDPLRIHDRQKKKTQE